MRAVATVLALSCAGAFVAPSQRRLTPRRATNAPSQRRLTPRRATDGDDELAFRDDELAAAFRSAAVRTTDARAELAQQKRRAAKEAAREARRPKKPRLAMADKRVRASQEPMNELNELLSREEGGWSSLEEAELLPKLGALGAGVVVIAALLTQNYDDMDELVSFPLLFRALLPLAFGALASFVAAGRCLARWRYVDERLSLEKLYFEETGWADGFMAKKSEDVFNRDQTARAVQVAPRLAWLSALTLKLGAAAAALFALAVVAP